jgi:hypothetical protein
MTNTATLESAVQIKPFEPPSMFKSAANFCAEYEPLAYIIEGVLRSGSLYTLTAKTGAGKTAFNVIASLAIATGRKDILGVEVTCGRVAYLAFENPDDVRMRLMVAAYLLNVDIEGLGENLIVLDHRTKPEDIEKDLTRLSRHGPFNFIPVDTFAAHFDGDDSNSSVQAGEFMRRYRPLTQLPNHPTVLVSAHPIKNANEEQLVPYGSGAILNEVDGNLTLWRKAETGIATLHHTKLRGPEFEPVPFRFELTGSPDVLDVKGRQVHVPTLRPVDKQSLAERENAEQNLDLALLRAMLDNPTGTQEQWGEAIGRAKSNVSGRLKRLCRDKAVESLAGKWSVTPKGKKAAEMELSRAHGQPNPLKSFVLARTEKRTVCSGRSVERRSEQRRP